MVKYKSGFWLVLLLCLLVRAYCLNKYFRAELVNDECHYLRIADTIINEGEFPGSFRAPGYLFFLAALRFSGAKNLPLAAQSAQIILSLLTCVILMEITRHSFSENTALMCGLLYAFSPGLAAFSLLLWSETLFIFLLLSSTVLLLKGYGNTRSLAVSGFFFGLAALTRSMILYFSPVLLYWFWKNRTSGKRFKKALVFFSFMLLTILPWTFRNYTVHHALVPIDTSGGFNLLMGNLPGAATQNRNDTWIYYLPYDDFSDSEVERNRIAALAAWKLIKQKPANFIRKFFYQTLYLWMTDSFVLRHLRNGWYGKTPLSEIRKITVLTAGFYILIILSAIGGLLLSPPGGFKRLTLLLTGYYTLVHGITFSLTRHRLPLIPFLMVFSAYFIVEIIKRKGLPKLFMTGHSSPPHDENKEGGIPLQYFHGKEKKFRRRWAAVVIIAFLVLGTTFSVTLDTWKTGGSNHRFKYVKIN